MSCLLDGLISWAGVTSPPSQGFSVPVSAYTQLQHVSMQPLPNFDGGLSDDDDSPIVTGSIFQPRTEYAARRLAAQPRALAETGQTAFIHHTQVGASAALQDALAASALHTVRTAANASMVRMEISRRVSLLIGAVSAALASADAEPHLMKLDLLPPVQALLVYQCIRLFSTSGGDAGDVTQQAQAERDEAVLLAWSRRLQREVRWPVDTEDGGGGGWPQWVRDESVRRAVLCAELLAGIYKFLRCGWDRAGARMALLGFTAQAALWEARSAAEWKVAWAAESGKRLHVAVADMNRDMAGAAPGDLEDLGVILYATKNGLDALEERLGGERTALRRWGLRS